MKKSELKNIIKECVREVIFEEGMLSGIISEVVKGMGTPNLVRENKKPLAPSAKTSEVRKQMLDAVANNSYEGVKKK